MEHIDGLHGAMSELMKRQNCLMMKNHHIICSEYLQLKVIHQNYSPKGCQSIFLLSQSFHYLCLEGDYLVKKYHDNPNTINTHNKFG